MNRRSVGMLFGVVAAATWLTMAAAGQTARPGQGNKKTSAAPSRSVLRTPWGDPDLQGIWSNATTTPLERPNQFGGKQEFTAEEAEQIDQEQSKVRSTDNAPRSGDPGTYNEAWWERGKLLKQTALVVDPADGRIPSLT